MPRSCAAVAALVLAACSHGRPSPPGAASRCEAEIVRGGPAGVPYASWRAAWDGLRSDPILHDEVDVVPPADEAEARAWLCGERGCEGRGPWLLEHEWADSGVVDRTDLLFEVAPGQLVAQPEVGVGIAGRCSRSDGVVLDLGPPIHVTTHVDGNTDMYVDPGEDEIRVCPYDEDGCQTACFSAEVRDVDRWFDPATGAELLSITRVAHPPGDPDRAWLSEEFTFPEQLTIIDAGHARLDGPGCAQLVEVPAWTR